MAELSAAQRAGVTRGLQRYWSRLREVVSILTKAELRAAINSTDVWINNNQNSFNNSLPAAAKANLTQAQKTIIFCVVACCRVSEATAKKVVGETD